MLILIVLLVIAILIRANLTNLINFTNYYHYFEQVTVSRVVDGDTIELQSGERVRFVGIDAPEFGEVGFHEARIFVVEKISQNRGVVYLQQSGNDTDHFGRLRRYVWLSIPQNSNNPVERRNLLLNQILLDTGHAVIWGN